MTHDRVQQAREWRTASGWFDCKRYDGEELDAMLAAYADARVIAELEVLAKEMCENCHLPVKDISGVLAHKFENPGAYATCDAEPIRRRLAALNVQGREVEER